MSRSYCSVRHDGENLSDHDPITLSLNIHWSSFASVPRHYVNKCIWHKASEQDLILYKLSLKASLYIRLLVFNVMCDRQYVSLETFKEAFKNTLF